MLEALHPGRIDLGIGRAPGTDQQTALALRRDPAALSAEDFPQHLLDLLGLLGDERVGGGLAERFVATPAARTAPEVVLLGSSGFSAQLAGALGLPFNYAHHFGTHAQAAVELYRDSFRPSADPRAGRTRCSPRTCWSPTPTRRRSGWPCPGG